MSTRDGMIDDALAVASVSRRDFLLRGAAGALAAVATPGIVIVPGAVCGATSTAKAATGTAKDADYVVHAVGRKMAPDGRTRGVFCYDGEIPGPVIRAKLGQTLRVKVINQLDIPTSIHWHGMHQPGTWQMDGVDGVSRAPIPPGQEFVYEFKATPAGTHWYHSHAGVQYSDGLIGPLIVDEETPPAKYDREEIVLINDWFLKQSDEILAGLIKGGDMDISTSDGTKSTPSDAGKEMPGMAKSEKSADKKSDKAMPGMAMGKADAGKSGMAGMKMGGKADIADVPFESALINGKGRFKNDTKAQLATIDVKSGETVRLRLINGSSTYQFRFQVDGHPLTVFATDGAPMQPVVVDNLMLSPGERYDVLLKATGKGNAWIRAVTLAGDEAKALLRYSDASGKTVSARLPAVTPPVLGKRALQPEQMKSPASVKVAEKSQELKFVLGGTMKPYAWSINGQEFPKADPIKLAANVPVRFVLENATAMDHPFHLHGHYFYVLGKPDKLNLTDPVQKDSVNVPANSTLVLEWFTNNPGHWFFHCHIEWHLATGMARVIEIG